MSWRDREYAQSESAYRPSRGGRSRFRLLGGSVVTTIIAANVAIYVIAQLIPTLGQQIYDYGCLQGSAVLRGEIWRVVTVQYLHDPKSIWHLLFNMLGLHFLGRALEARWSPRRFFTIYTLCGVAGSLFFTLLVVQGVIHPRQVAVGASACVYGLLGIVAVLFPTQIVYVQFLFPVKIRTLAYILGAVAFLTTVQRGANYGGEACHLAGLVFGVWWAAKGERWWSSTEWRLPRRSSARKPTVRTREPLDPRSPFADESEIDRILRKVYEGGLHTLTEAEKATLQADTERKRGVR